METIDPKKFLVQIASILDSVGIDYFITGGFAVAIWGRPRSTSDIDAVIQMSQPQIGQLIKALRGFSRLGYIDEETVRDAVRSKGEFNFIDPETGLKVDFWIAKDDSRAILQFKRRKSELINDKKIYFIAPEDLILNKLLWHQQSGSLLQLDDIKSIFKVSGNKLDMRYLKQWAAKIEVLNLMEDLIKDKKDRP